MTKITETDLKDYHKALKALSPYHSKIEARIEYVFRTVLQIYGAELDWYDYRNYDGNVDTLMDALGTDSVSVHCYEIATKTPLDDEIYFKLDDGDYCEFFHEFPLRWLHEDFEDELARGKAAHEKEVEDEKKAKADKKAKKKAEKERLKKAAAAKLTPDERKALGLK